ncbi:MAG: dephospho-CoA kinase [Micrococcales bacterium]
MFLVALTGGIAAGKSTVAKRWVELGAVEVDADEVAREVVEPGTLGLARIRETFGNEVIDENGVLDRTKLASLVFGIPDQLAKLNAIVHPLVQARSLELMKAAPEGSIVVYNVPLLVEAARDSEFDFVVTVEAPEEKQIERMMTSRCLTEEQARTRIASQASPIERANVADRILSSNQSLELMLNDADALFREIQQLAAKKAAAESNETAK